MNSLQQSQEPKQWILLVYYSNVIKLKEVQPLRFVVQIILKPSKYNPIKAVAIQVLHLVKVCYFNECQEMTRTVTGSWPNMSDSLNLGKCNCWSFPNQLISIFYTRSSHLVFIWLKYLGRIYHLTVSAFKSNALYWPVALVYWQVNMKIEIYIIDLLDGHFMLFEGGVGGE